MKHVERIRAAVIGHQRRALALIRGYISLTDGNLEAIDRLRGPVGDMILAKCTDLILRELGHETNTPVEAPTSHVRRSIARVRGKKRGDGPPIE
jgi:hypothetical protein